MVPQPSVEVGDRRKMSVHEILHKQALTESAAAEKTKIVEWLADFGCTEHPDSYCPCCIEAAKRLKAKEMSALYRPESLGDVQPWHWAIDYRTCRQDIPKLLELVTEIRDGLKCLAEDSDHDDGLTGCGVRCMACRVRDLLSRLREITENHGEEK